MTQETPRDERNAHPPSASPHDAGDASDARLRDERNAMRQTGLADDDRATSPEDATPGGAAGNPRANAREDRKTPPWKGGDARQKTPSSS